jgi:selenoprotein W-related protein
LADAIKKEVGIEPKLTKGKDGIFDVLLDGKMVFSKHQQGRFPEHDEVLAPLGEKLKPVKK